MIIHKLVAYCLIVLFNLLPITSSLLHLGSQFITWEWISILLLTYVGLNFKDNYLGKNQELYPEANVSHGLRVSPCSFIGTDNQARYFLQIASNKVRNMHVLSF